MSLVFYKNNNVSGGQNLTDVVLYYDLKHSRGRASGKGFYFQRNECFLHYRLLSSKVH